MKKMIWNFLRILILAGVISSAALVLPRVFTAWYAKNRIFSPTDAPHRPVAIVFGAGLWRDGSPSPVLRDRVAAAADLFSSGRVEILLMSGDNSRPEYNEPEAMRQYALSLGVPDDAIVLDYAGRRTYDTCYRAREIFHLDEVLVVTQRFHLPRAIYTCNALGVAADGVQADRRSYRRSAYTFWRVRELPATARAFWDVHLARPVPVLGNPEPIFTYLPK